MVFLALPSDVFVSADLVARVAQLELFAVGFVNLEGLRKVSHDPLHVVAE